jgi:hypothetical protein
MSRPAGLALMSYLESMTKYTVCGGILVRHEFMLITRIR